MDTLEARQQAKERVQRRKLIARQDEHRHGEASEVGHREAAAGQDGRRRGQAEDRPADIAEARLQQAVIPVVQDAPVGPGTERCGSIGVSAGQIRQQVVLNSGQKACRAQRQAEHHDPPAIQQQRAYPGERFARRQQRAIGDVAAEHQQRVVRRLADPGSQDLADRQARDAPPLASSAPTLCLYCPLGAEEHQR